MQDRRELMVRSDAAPPNSILEVGHESLITSHYFVGPGGGLRSISVGTAIDRAPFFPTARAAKK